MKKSCVAFCLYFIPIMLGAYEESLEVVDRINDQTSDQVRIDNNDLRRQKERDLSRYVHAANATQSLSLNKPKTPKRPSVLKRVTSTLLAPPTVDTSLEVVLADNNASEETSLKDFQFQINDNTSISNTTNDSNSKSVEEKSFFNNLLKDEDFQKALKQEYSFFKNKAVTLHVFNKFEATQAGSKLKSDLTLYINYMSLSSQSREQSLQSGLLISRLSTYTPEGSAIVLYSLSTRDNPQLQQSVSLKSIRVLLGKDNLVYRDFDKGKGSIFIPVSSYKKTFDPLVLQAFSLSSIRKSAVIINTDKKM